MKQKHPPSPVPLKIKIEWHRNRNAWFRSRPAARQFVDLLLERINADGRCWMKLETIAAEMGHSSVGGVQRLIREIKGQGYIAKTEPLKTASGFRSGTIFVLQVPIEKQLDLDLATPDEATLKPADGQGRESSMIPTANRPDDSSRESPRRFVHKNYPKNYPKDSSLRSESPSQSELNVSSIVTKSHGGPPPAPEARARPDPRGGRLPEDWRPNDIERHWAKTEHGLSDPEIDAITEEFRNYWHDVAGPRARKIRWGPTWRNQVLKVMRWRKRDGRKRQGGGDVSGESAIDAALRRRLGPD